MALEGVAQLTRQLAELKSLEDGKALRRCTGAGIRQAFKRAHETIPVGTEIHRTKVRDALRAKGIKGLTVGPGFARDSLAVATTVNKSTGIASAALSVRKAAYYAVQFLEFGTRHMHAKPWLLPSFYGTRGEQEEALKTSLAKSVEKAARTR